MTNEIKRAYEAIVFDVYKLECSDVIVTSGFDGEDHEIRNPGVNNSSVEKGTFEI